MKTTYQLGIAMLFSMGCSHLQAAPATDLTITVRSQDVLVGSRRFDNADTLERHVRSLTARSVRVQACGSTAIVPWKLVVYRLRTLPIEAAVIGADDPACASKAVLTPVSMGKRSALLDQARDPAVDMFWQQMMP